MERVDVHFTSKIDVLNMRCWKKSGKTTRKSGKHESMVANLSVFS